MSLAAVMTVSDSRPHQGVAGAGAIVMGVGADSLGSQISPLRQLGPVEGQTVCVANTKVSSKFFGQTSSQHCGSIAWNTQGAFRLTLILKSATWLPLQGPTVHSAMQGQQVRCSASSFSVLSMMMPA